MRALRSCCFPVPSEFFVSLGSSLTNESSLTRADERALIPEIIVTKDGLERFFSTLARSNILAHPEVSNVAFLRTRGLQNVNGCQERAL